MEEQGRRTKVEVEGWNAAGYIDPDHRREDIFESKELHLEPGVVVDHALVTEVKAALRACARFAKQIVAQDALGRRPVRIQNRGCQTAVGVILVRADPRGLRALACMVDRLLTRLSAQPC